MNEVEVIDIKEVFTDLKEGQTIVKQLDFDVSDCLYLDSSLKHLIDSLDPNYFRDKDFEPSKYQLSSEEKKKIALASNYQSIKDLVVSPDKNLRRYLKDQFGLKGYEEEITDAVLVYKQKAFIEFSNDFSSSGYLIELIEPNKVSLLIVYVTID